MLAFQSNFKPSKHKSSSVIFRESKRHGCMAMTLMLTILKIAFLAFASTVQKVKHVASIGQQPKVCVRN